MAGADGVQRFPDALGRPVPPLQPKQRVNRLFGKASSPRPRPEMSPTVGAPFLMGRAFEGHVHILFLAGAPFRRGNASPSLPAQAFRSLKTAPPQARPPAGGTYAALRQDASARRPCPPSPLTETSCLRRTARPGISSTPQPAERARIKKAPGNPGAFAKRPTPPLRRSFPPRSWERAS